MSGDGVGDGLGQAGGEGQADDDKGEAPQGRRVQPQPRADQDDGQGDLSAHRDYFVSLLNV